MVTCAKLSWQHHQLFSSH